MENNASRPRNGSGPLHWLRANSETLRLLLLVLWIVVMVAWLVAIILGEAFFGMRFSRFGRETIPILSLLGTILAISFRKNRSSEGPPKLSAATNRSTVKFAHWVCGDVLYIQVSSLSFERRVTSSFQPEFAELRDLEFTYLYAEGESFSLFRLFLVIPAMFVVKMWLEKVPITTHEGARILVGYPVFVSKDRSALAHPNGLGIKIYTSFRDGTLLASKNYGDGDPLGPRVEVNFCERAGIRETWAAHEKRIRQLEDGGKKIVRETNFEAYAEMLRRETALW